MLSIIIITSSIIICNLVNGAIWNCVNKYEHKNPSTNEGAVKCADEGSGSCSGAGRVYYGSALTWTYKDLNEGETISCTNSAFGCDPLVAFKKSCYIKKKHQLVSVNFRDVKILKTNHDGSSGGNVEEWNVVPSSTITMNVDFYDDLQTWDACNFNIESLYHDEFAGSPCEPPHDNQQLDYNCVIGGFPVGVMVTTSVYRSGLKYTFDLQMGDYDANGVFDNGPIFDFTYTEPTHKSIVDLRNSPGWTIERYFTRTGPEGREARIYVDYTLHEIDDDGSGINPWEDVMSCDTNNNGNNEEYVTVNFRKIKILETNDDGNNEEEWNVLYTSTGPRITMNVDFIDDMQTWAGCNFDITNIYKYVSVQDELSMSIIPACHPPANQQSSNGFYDCMIGGLPEAIVDANVYESGLKYTFNIQMGDYDANGVFDNGPLFDFTYTEPTHKSIDDLKNSPDQTIVRYFTRTGPEGRQARIWVEYTLFEDNGFSEGVEFMNCNF